MRGRTAVGGIVAFLAAWLCAGSLALAAPVISVGAWDLLPDTPGQEIPIYVTGGDLIDGLNLNLQIGDGGVVMGGTAGPVIQSVDLLTGTIFGAVGGTAGVIGAYPQIGQWFASLPLEVPDIAADGLLATITIDTTGFFEGTWGLYLDTTLAGATSFTGAGGAIQAAITDGAINVVLPIPTLTWDGSDGEEWGSAHWDDGSDLVAPAGGEAMVVPSGKVQVEGEFTGELAAASLLVDAATVEIGPQGLLEVLGAVTFSGGTLDIADGGTLLAGGQVLLEESTLTGSGTIVGETIVLGGFLSPGSLFSQSMMPTSASAPASAPVATGDSSIMPVPEPTTLAMLAMLAATGLLAATRRRRAARG